MACNKYASSLCRKADNKLSVLARLSNFMSSKFRGIISKTFIEFQFGFCPLIVKGINKTILIICRSVHFAYFTKIAIALAWPF